MDFENQIPEELPSNPPRWPVYVLVLLIAAIIGFQIARTISESKQISDYTDVATALQQGDYYAKCAVAGLQPQNPSIFANYSIRQYEQALPRPAALRRIAIVREFVLKESGKPEISLINSPRAVKGLSKVQIRKLDREAEMWRDIYRPGDHPQAKVKQYVARVKQLNLGPLKYAAISVVYEKTGYKKEAAQAAKEAKSRALTPLIGLFALIFLVISTGLIGLIVAVRFFIYHGGELRRASMYFLPAGALIAGFFVYLVSQILIVGPILRSFGIDGQLAFQAIAMLIAFLWGMWTISSFSRGESGIFAGMGFRSIGLRKTLVWGFGGYAAMLPFLAVAAGIAYVLQLTLLRGIPSPEHPITPLVSESSGFDLALVFLIGSVLAPVFEEALFRGALYSALRTWMGVWRSAILVGIIFAMVHPTVVGQFLPLAVIGTSFCLIRERTGSIYPSMIAHALHNTISFVLIRMLA